LLFYIFFDIIKLSKKGEREMSEIEIVRSVKMKQSMEKTQVGDVIQFMLTSGETVRVMKMTEDGIWCFVDCLRDECDMNSMNEYLAALLEQFPDDIRELLEPFDDGCILRLPTEKEVFRTNEVGKPEHGTVRQWEPMKERRNRIAFRGLNGGWEWWWTKTPHKKNAAYFARVGSYGNCYCDIASASGGVRPAFYLRRKEKG
jgi:hypothetical protein